MVRGRLLHIRTYKPVQDLRWTKTVTIFYPGSKYVWYVCACSVWHGCVQFMSCVYSKYIPSHCTRVHTYVLVGGGGGEECP